MGTHSTIKFYTKHNKCILSIYNQYDGYITGEGQVIYDFLKDIKGNGFDDIALLYVLYKKKGPYHTYATTEQDIQEYNYKIYDTDEDIKISIQEEKYIEELQDYALVTTLRYGSLEDLKHYINEELIKEQEIMKGKGSI